MGKTLYLCTGDSFAHYHQQQAIKHFAMSHTNKQTLSEEYRREELIRMIGHNLEKLTLQELEALYYDMSTKTYIND